jgi:hypothetical protein
MKFFPDDNVWYQPINHLPVDQHSDKWLANIGRNANLHPDFGSGKYEGKEMGIPLNIYATRADVPAWKEFTFLYADQSDHVLYPFGKIEEGTDQHLCVLIQDEGIIYELFLCDWDAGKAGSGAVFRNNNERRPWGWTSADAAGLPIIPGLVRYDEVAAGYINHAIRFTLEKTWGVDLNKMASHWTSGKNGELMVPTPEGAMRPGMGARFRLKADFDISGFHPFLHPILIAMKTFGLALADNGSNMFFSGVPDERWDNNILGQLKRIKAASFEAVDATGQGLTKESYAVVGAVSVQDPVTAPVPAPKPKTVKEDLVIDQETVEIKMQSKDLMKIIDSYIDLREKVNVMAKQIDELFKRYMV